MEVNHREAEVQHKITIKTKKLHFFNHFLIVSELIVIAVFCRNWFYFSTFCLQ